MRWYVLEMRWYVFNTNVGCLAVHRKRENAILSLAGII